MVAGLGATSSTGRQGDCWIRSIRTWAQLVANITPKLSLCTLPQTEPTETMSRAVIHTRRASTKWTGSSAHS